MKPQKKPKPRACRVEVQFSDDELALIKTFSEDLGVPVAAVVRLAFRQWAKSRSASAVA